MIDLRHLRDDFPILDREVNGWPLVYLDSAATTQKPVQVIDAVDTYYRTINANVHRGAHTLSAEATDAYEGARSKVASFLNAASPDEIVFSRGATTALNHIAYGWGLNHLKEGDRVVLTVMEHHANVVPWQLVARHTGIELVYLTLDEQYEVDLTGLDDLIDERVKVVAFSGMSNVTGTIGPVKALVEAARSVGALVVVDGAQLVPHAPTDVQEIDADFLVFSGHKMYGPSGVGVVYGKMEHLEDMPPWQGGGNMIQTVTFDHTTYSGVPAKFEAGTPTITDAVGLGAAVDYIDRIGIDNINRYEHTLTEYAMERLYEVPGIRMIGTSPGKVSVLSFVIDGVRTEDVGRYLDREGIAVRAGHHCAMPTMQRFGVTGTVRPSVAMYNTHDEVDVLVDVLKRYRQK